MLDLHHLNEAQREAVAWSGGPLLLLAGPGSGKTFTVMWRILYLLERGVPPEEILVITYTKEAAASMQRRFRQISGHTYPVNFGTFHSVFYHILLESGGFNCLRLLNESQKKNFMLSVLKQFGEGAEPKAELRAELKEELRGEPKTELGEDASRILAAVSLYKNTEDRERAEAKMPAEWRERFGEILSAYREATGKAGGMDFDDMLFECRRLLAGNSSVRRGWQKRFPYILIDEFQDCNPIQYEVVKLLAAEPYNLFAVGDDDQSIYGFRGAKPDILRQFSEDFKAKRLLLNVNYRCRTEIVNASLSVIGENQNRFPKALRAADTSAEEVRGRTAVRKEREKAAETESGLHIRFFQDREKQTDWLLQQAAEWRRLHAGDGERCAVLFRTNSQMQRNAAALLDAGISFFKREAGKSTYEHFVAKDIMAYLLLAAGDGSREHLLRIMNRPVRYISREAVGEGKTLAEVRAYYVEQPDAEHGRNGEALARLSCLQRQLDILRHMSPALGVRYVLKAIGYDGYLQTRAKDDMEKLAEWRELSEWLLAEAGRFQSVGEWAKAQRRCIREAAKGPFPSEGVRSGEGEALWLMTVHGAKGLEFDRVIIPDCNERVYPHGELLGKEQVEEERRIFYVAMTRAKKSLDLLCLTGDSARPRLLSRFINPLLDSYTSSSASSSSFSSSSASSSSSISSSNSQLSRYSSKASATASYSSSSSI